MTESVVTQGPSTAVAARGTNGNPRSGRKPGMAIGVKSPFGAGTADGCGRVSFFEEQAAKAAQIVQESAARLQMAIELFQFVLHKAEGLEAAVGGSVV